MAISGRVGEVADARLDDLDAGLLEAVLDLVRSWSAISTGFDAQRDVALVVRVVRMRRGEIAQRGLGLDVDEVLVVVDLEQRLGGVGDLPDDDRGDLDRVAVVVVHLELGGLEVADADRHLWSLRERIDPSQAVIVHRPVVLAEQHHDACLVGLHGCQSVEQIAPEQRHGQHDDEADDAEQHLPFLDAGEDVDDVPDDDDDQRDHPHEQDEERWDTRDRECGSFPVHRCVAPFSQLPGDHDRPSKA